MDAFRTVSASALLRVAHMTVWLARHALNAMKTEGAEKYPLESGGILLGWRRGEDKVVADIVGPGANALHGRTRFLPDHKWQVSEIDRIFRETKGDIDYLGDWHTHPDGVAAMSDEDSRTLSRIARRVRGALMMILAGPNFDADELGCWRSGPRERLFPLRYVTHSQDLVVFDRPANWPSAHRIW